MIRIGNGYDVHRLVEERRLVLGGVVIPYELGLDGHSDADVLVHAIMDATLGAMGMADIGVLFPDTDKKIMNISSILLLKKVVNIMIKKNYTLINLDSVIIAQRPKLSSFIPDMKKNIGAVFRESEDAIGIKATTTEGLDAVGEGRGIAAYAVILLQKNN